MVINNVEEKSLFYYYYIIKKINNCFHTLTHFINSYLKNKNYIHANARIIHNIINLRHNSYENIYFCNLNFYFKYHLLLFLCFYVVFVVVVVDEFYFKNSINYFLLKFKKKILK